MPARQGMIAQHRDPRRRQTIAAQREKIVAQLDRDPAIDAVGDDIVERPDIGRRFGETLVE